MNNPRSNYDNRQAISDDEFVAQKVQQLRKAFIAIDMDGDDTLSQQELITFLDQKSAGQFNRDIAEELYEQMDKDHDGKVTVNEFIRVFLEADTILRKKIQAARNYQDTYRQRIQECAEKAEEAKHTEQLNAYGIAQNSIVNTVILETKATNVISPTLLLGCFVEVSLDGQQISRTDLFRNAADYPHWDDKFTFQVARPGSALRFILYKDAAAGGQMLGNNVIPLDDLIDQTLFDTWISLNTRERLGDDLQLHVKLQWIHSKVKYYLMEGRKFEENYHKEEEEIVEYEKYLQQLNDPFLGMTVAVHAGRPDAHPYIEPQIQDAPFEAQRKRPDNHFSFNEPSSGQPQMQRPDRIDMENRMPRQFESQAEAYPKGMSPEAQEIENRVEMLMNKAALLLVNKPNPNEFFWKRLTLIICLVEVIVSIFIIFGRAAFLDLVLAIVLILYITQGTLKESVSLRYLTLIIFGSIALDFFWLLIYSGVWTSHFAKEVLLESGVRSFAVFFTYVNLLVKIILGLVCYMLGIKSTKPQNLAPGVMING